MLKFYDTPSEKGEKENCKKFHYITFWPSTHFSVSLFSLPINSHQKKGEEQTETMQKFGTNHL